MSSTTPAKPAVQPSAEMLRMLNAFLTVQALHVAAVLGVADLLAAGPKSLDDLAAGTKADRPSLHRLLEDVFEVIAIGALARIVRPHECGRVMSYGHREQTLEHLGLRTRDPLIAHLIE